MCIISVIRCFPFDDKEVVFPPFPGSSCSLALALAWYFVHVFLVCLYFSSSPKQAPKKEKAAPSSKPAKSSGGGGKQKKKKWSKGKQKEKVNNMVLFDQATYDKLLVEVPKYKLITPSVLSDRLRISGSLARRAIKELMAKGTIRLVAAHANQQIYTRATNT
ncbi:unnamed protein product [Sphagnum troendelagicum]|uniref:40S ribosomal protein S25 n=1 Tax=Sphagnum troendelagicum TaxID=128251 RepID=A0ABP0U8L4_9BRYO